MGSEAGSRSPATGFVRCLSFHARYGCQNTGVCCASGWEIPVETRLELALRPRLRGLDPNRLPNGPEGFRSTLSPPEGCTSVFKVDEVTGSCWFRDEPAARCAVHRELGTEALPSACRQFPRICVLEPDGVSVSLSHYCPTAAGLLFDGNPIFSVVGTPEAFPSSWPFEGLDARNAYPPLLRPGVLLGFDGLRAFEDEAIAVLVERDAWDALAQIERGIEAVRSWTPSDGPLVDLIRRSFSQARATGGSYPSAENPSQLLMSIRTPRIPGAPASDLPAFGGTLPAWSAGADLAVRKYLAARLVGAWITFQADDLRALGRFLRLCLNTVLLFKADDRRIESESETWKEAIRSADLWLLHYADPDLLAARMG